MTLSFRILFLLALLVALVHPGAAEAHRFAPSLLKVIETSDHIYNVVWKTPTEALSRTQQRPIWPTSLSLIHI